MVVKSRELKSNMAELQGKLEKSQEEARKVTMEAK